mmetsp:Transcript_10270/g.18967  ORF Transcript_10270/g.18967 Transcript_10270/m.18967 type:complete len:635 (-) Transcript_10270:191-2095(-)
MILCPRKFSIVARKLKVIASTAMSPSRSLCIRQFSSIDFVSPNSTLTPSVDLLENITLTDDESRIFNTLLAAANYRGTGTVLRCAGGWVRDKLLGKTSCDIDIAIDNAMGREFAESVNAYLNSQGQATRTAAVIQSNPDQSKHLETARMKIYDLWIDLVNLRSETYAEDSRIPEMALGTPEEDAMRRDFTVNSLFYNLNEKKIEDFTGHGLEDLRVGLIRTPLHPIETFRDDPLRALRAVRFAARFGFRLDDAIVSAAADDKIQNALAKKVSRERIGTELEGMFNGMDPVRAMRLLDELGLFKVVFALPPPLDSSPLATEASYGKSCVACVAAASGILTHLKGAESPSSSSLWDEELSLEDRRFFLLAALLLPLRDLTAEAAKGKTQSAAAVIIRSNIKWRVKDIEACDTLHLAVQEIAPVLEMILEEGCEHRGEGTSGGDRCTKVVVNDHSDDEQEGKRKDTRLAMGRLLRVWKQHWRLALLLAPLPRFLGHVGGAAEALSREGRSPYPPPLAKVPAEVYDERLHEEVRKWVPDMAETARKLVEWVEKEELGDCWKWKPLLNGKQIMDVLEWTKAGQAMGSASTAVIEWQIQNPNGSVDECKAFLKSAFGSQKAGPGREEALGEGDNRKRKLI